MSTNGNGLALAFHIYREVGFTQLRKLLNDEQKQIAKQLHCLQPIKAITEVR